jgi:hypothetical protein
MVVMVVMVTMVVLTSMVVVMVMAPVVVVMMMVMMMVVMMMVAVARNLSPCVVDALKFGSSIGYCERDHVAALTKAKKSTTCSQSARRKDEFFLGLG